MYVFLSLQNVSKLNDYTTNCLTLLHLFALLTTAKEEQGRGGGGRGEVEGRIERDIEKRGMGLE